MAITSAMIKQMAHACGFELAGVTPAEATQDFSRFQAWREAGFAGEMHYLTDHRGDLRASPLHLLPSAKSIICLGKLYNTAHPYSIENNDAGKGWISRYAWGSDYHDVLRTGLLKMVELIRKSIGEDGGGSFEWKICIDTAPLLERSYAQAAGLGWIGKNSCLINQQQGSWFFLAELLLSIPLAGDEPAPFRCGTCRRCIDACPTEAIVPSPAGGWMLDARLCISYLTIEKRGAVPYEMQPLVGRHIFGCDICQDVCPWNGEAAITDDLSFSPSVGTAYLADWAAMTEEQFSLLFRRSPVWRTKYEGFLRNVAMALGNSRDGEMLAPLRKLAAHPNGVVAAAAQNALRRLEATIAS